MSHPSLNRTYCQAVARSDSAALRLAVAWVLSLSLAGATPASAQPSADAVQRDKRPNIVLIMADDIGFECFGCYGSDQYKTPHLDRLARQGMRFEHCYVQPLCTPTRVKLMTGLSNARNYSAFSVLNRDQKTIGHYFKEAGYATAVAGKWQLYGAEHYPERFRGKGTLPHDAGFDHACLWQVDRLGERFHGPLMWIDGENRQFDQTHYGPQVATDYLIDFMRSHRLQPFFAYYPMILTHNPFVPTPDSQDPSGSDRQSNFEDMVTYMDKLVGQIVAATVELEISDRTMIVFVGDNGTNRQIRSTLSGKTLQGGKATTTDAGTRVPLIAYWPNKIPMDKVCQDLVDASDFLPTLLSACDIVAPDGLDGISFWPQLKGEAGNPRPWIYCYYCPRPERTAPVRFARDHRFKLYGDGRFYDVVADPLEQEPLISDRWTEAARLANAKLEGVLQTMPATGQTLLKFPQ